MGGVADERHFRPRFAAREDVGAARGLRGARARGHLADAERRRVPQHVPRLASARAIRRERAKHALTFGQVPLWDPYDCGGMDGLGTPQSRWASPTFLLTLVFGTLRAEPIVCFLFLLLGLEGTFRYARSRGATHLGAALAAPLFGLSGFFAVAPALGWVHFMGFALVPWIVWGLRVAMRGDALGVAVSAGMLAAMVGFGGTYPAPMTGPFCAFEVGEALWAKKQDRARLNTAASMATLVALFALGLAALRLWPVIQTLTMAPRIIGGAPTLTPQKIALGLLGRIKPDEAGDFPLSGNYLVGMFGGLAFVVGLLRRRTMAITTAAFLSWLASGHALIFTLRRSQGTAGLLHVALPRAVPRALRPRRKRRRGLGRHATSGHDAGPRSGRAARPAAPAWRRDANGSRHALAREPRSPREQHANGAQGPAHGYAAGERARRVPPGARHPLGARVLRTHVARRALLLRRQPGPAVAARAETSRTRSTSPSRTRAPSRGPIGAPQIWSSTSTSREVLASS